MNILKTKKIISFVICVIFVSALFGITSDAKEKENKKYIALTFDDGPHPVYTAKILDILEEKKIAATFFIVGFRAELHPDALKRMKKLDCEIGNHTYSHADLSGNNVKNGVTYEIEKCSEAIFAATGEYPVVYRPPFGKISKANEKRVPLKKILWTVDSLDWNIKNKDKVIRNVVKNVKDGSIILMHDFYESTLRALPDIIEVLSDEGYEFVTVSELAALKKISHLQEYFLD
ncbi:MAG: polysaccharide deacetylase family protein [Oscillospiraceae bacterium]|nr:polysaccharide deacetylase family protein [Oscillospiraceae bacterium]